MKSIYIIILILLGSLVGCKSGIESSESQNSEISSQISVPKVTDIKIIHPGILMTGEQLDLMSV